MDLVNTLNTVFKFFKYLSGEIVPLEIKQLFKIILANHGS